MGSVIVDALDIVFVIALFSCFLFVFLDGLHTVAKFAVVAAFHFLPDLELAGILFRYD